MKFRILITLTAIFVLGTAAIVYTQSNKSDDRSLQQQTEATPQTRITENDENAAKKLDGHEQDLMGLNATPKSNFGIVYNVLIYVTHVAPGSPAEEAGLRQGDLINRIGGMQVRGIQTLKAVQSNDPGTVVDVEYLRPNANSDTFTKFRARVPLAALQQ